MNLLVAELWRCWSRRATKLLLLLGALAIVGVMVWLALRPQYRTERYSQFGPSLEQAEAHVVETRIDQRLDLVDDLSGAMAATGTALMVLGVLLGSTLLGAEFGAGSLSTQLTYEPRRIRVWATKATAAALTTAAVCAALLLVMTAGMAVVATTRGIADGIDSGFLFDRALELGRLAAAGALGALFGFAITGIARKTVAAIVVFLVMSFILEPVLVNNFGWAEARTPMDALRTFAFDPFAHDEGGGAWDSLGRAALVACVWIFGLLVISGLQFRRRELR